MRAIAKKDKMKAKARRAAEKAHRAKKALIAKAAEEKHELRVHAEHVEERAIAARKAAKRAQLHKLRLADRAREHAAAVKRRLAMHKYRLERRKMRRDARRVARDNRREKRLKEKAYANFCHKQVAFHRHHYHEVTQKAYVKR